MLVAAPAALWLGARRLASGTRTALVVTILVSWTVAAVALPWLFPETDDISVAILFFLFVAPMIVGPIAAIVATRLVQVRGQLVQACILAVIGWIAGAVAAFFVTAENTRSVPSPQFALEVAAPAIYCACGAVLAAGLGCSRRAGPGSGS
jgi:peptidoglycan/LPS O-acetylase OafA/YrhL